MGKRVPEEFVLLCETCGYEIEGLPADGACPECGREIARSVPVHRPGSLAQERLRPLTLLRTWRDTLTQARQVFDRTRPTSASTSAQLTASLITASAIGSGGFGAIGIARALARRSATTGDQTGSWSIAALWLGGSVALFSIALAVLLLLTFIEERGIRFWGPRRGWRITPAIAKTICAHASVGWVLGSILAVAGHAVGWVLLEVANRHNLGIFRGPFQLSPITLPVLGFLAGMLTFEVLVYIGMGRMKFANRQRPNDAPGEQPAPVPAPSRGPGARLAPPGPRLAGDAPEQVVTAEIPVP